MKNLQNNFKKLQLLFELKEQKIRMRYLGRFGGSTGSLRQAHFDRLSDRRDLRVLSAKTSVRSVLKFERSEVSGSL